MEILGQPQALRYLTQGFDRGIISPSLLFVGPDGVGKRLCAMELARWFGCENTGANQDLLVVNRALQAMVMREKPETQTAIKIESVRHADKFLSLKPFVSQRRVVIIEEANKLTIEAANALLKLLEEPPAQAQIVLVSNDEHALPSTVVSRCAVVRFRPIPTKIIADWLEREHAVSESAAMEIADRAGGSFEKALALKDEEHATTDLSDYTLDEFFTMLAGTNWRKEGRKQAEAAVTNLIETSQRKLESGDLAQTTRLSALLAARKQIDRNVPVKLVLETLYVKLEGVR